MSTQKDLYIQLRVIHNAFKNILFSSIPAPLFAASVCNDLCLW